MKIKVYTFWSIFIVASFIRVVLSFNQEIPDIAECYKQMVSGNGYISNEPERKDSGQVFIIKVEELFLANDDKLCSTDIYIRVKTKLYPRYSFEDKITFSGKISEPINFKSSNGRSFDYRGYLAKDKVFYEIKSGTVDFIKNSGEVLENSKFNTLNISNYITSVLYKIKRIFVNNLEKTLGEPHAALASGLVVGEKSSLGNSLLNDFRIVGLIHIVVLSGFNITIVGDAIRKMLLFLPRVWGISLGGLGIGLFGIMVGGGATVVRSCFMAGIALSADLFRRDYSVIRALIFAGLIMIIINPTILLHDPSFQLSFLATLGLVLLSSPIEEKIPFISEKFGLRGIVASTVATQIFVSPFILHMMGSISIIGMLVNILVLPIIPLTMLLVFLTGFFGFIYMPIAHFFAFISHLLLSYELFIVDYFAKVPFASVNVSVFSFWWVSGFYLVLLFIFILLKYIHNKKIKKNLLDMIYNKKIRD